MKEVLCSLWQYYYQIALRGLSIRVSILLVSDALLRYLNVKSESGSEAVDGKEP